MNPQPRHIHSFAEAAFKIIEGTDDLVEVGLVPDHTDPEFFKDARPSFHRVTVADVEMALVHFADGIFVSDNETNLDIEWTIIDAAVLSLIATGKIVTTEALSSMRSRRS